MEFESLVEIIMKYLIDRDTAENIAQDILIREEGDSSVFEERD